jgi:hypothetical protein
MRPVHRPKAPTIDYRDRRGVNLRILGGTLLLGMTIGASGVLLVSMAKPVARVETPAIVVPAPVVAKPEHPSASLDAYKATEMKNALIRQSPALRGCYDSFLLDEPDVPEGKVTIDFQIDPDGKVVAPGIVESELESQELKDCLVARVAAFAFPPPPDRVRAYAAHTFHFQRDAR